MKVKLKVFLTNFSLMYKQTIKQNKHFKININETTDKHNKYSSCYFMIIIVIV